MSCPVNESAVPAFDSSNCCKPEALVVEASEAISIKVTNVASLSLSLCEACMLKIVKKIKLDW